MRRTFEIEVDVPPGVGAARLRHYIRDAVGGWSGSFEVDDPLCGFRHRIVAVRSKAEPAGQRVPRGR